MGVSKRCQLLIADEASFAEGAGSSAAVAALSFAAGASTYGYNIPIEGEPVVDIPHERVTDMTAQARLAVLRAGHPGPRMGGRIQFRTYLIGHGGTAAGALTKTWQQKMLEDGLGGGKTDVSGTTISAATSASSFTLSSAGNWAKGVVGRVGTLGDTRGGGAPFVVGAISGAVITSLNALPAQPASPDVVYAAMMAYHVEGATLQTKRFCVMHEDTGNQIHLLGCQLAGLEIDTSGPVPMLTWTYQAAYFERAARTWPSSLTLEAANPGAIAGSAFYQDVGTVTRNTLQLDWKRLSIDLGLSLVATEGAGGAGKYQTILGWVRNGVRPKVRLATPWTSSFETTWDQTNAAMVGKQLLLALQHDDGRTNVMYFPNLLPSGQRPSKSISNNDQTYVEAEFEANEGPDTATDLTRSSFRLAAA